MANRYFINGGVNSNWSSTTNWSDTSGGAGGFSVPGSSDDVFLDANGNVTCTLATSTVKSFTVSSGYTATFASGTAVLTVTGDVTLGANMAMSGTGTLSIGTSGGTNTITSNGFVVSMNVRLGHQSGSGGVTITLADDWNVSGTLTLGQSSGTGNVVINSNNLYPSGNVTMNGSGAARVTSGTTVLNFTSGTNQTMSSSAGGLLRLDVVVNKSGNTLTITDITYDTGTFTYTAGTVSNTGTLSVRASTTFATSGMSWNHINCINNGVTLTLTNTFTVAGDFAVSSSNTTVTISGATYFTAIGGTFSMTGVSGCVFTPANDMTAGAVTISASTTCTINSYVITCSGDFLIGASDLSGTGGIKMVNTSNVTGSQTTRNIAASFIIDTSGTITFVGTLRFTGTFTHTQGTTAGGTSTVTITTGTTNVNAAGLNFNALVVGTSTFNSTGNFGFTTNTLTSTTGTLTLDAGATYTINTDLSLIGTAAARITILSGTASSYANFILAPGATHTVAYVTATDIDSSLGQTIWDYKPVLTRTLNWNTLGPTLLTRGIISVS